MTSRSQSLQTILNTNKTPHIPHTNNNNNNNKLESIFLSLFQCVYFFPFFRHFYRIALEFESDWFLRFCPRLTLSTWTSICLSAFASFLGNIRRHRLLQFTLMVMSLHTRTFQSRCCSILWFINSTLFFATLFHPIQYNLALFTHSLVRLHNVLYLNSNKTD